MRVLVTGSDGFVGTWLLRHLAEVGDDVVALDPAIDIAEGETVRRAVAAADADAVIHLAGQASVAASWDAPVRTFTVNATGTLNLVLAAGTCPRPPRVLLVSSAEVYGLVRPADLPLGEDRPLAPVSPYAMSKAAAEVVGGQAWRSGGLEVMIARPFNHCGPGQSPAFVVPAFAHQIVEARAQGRGVLHVGDLSARRDLTDVRDVVRAYRLLLDAGEAGGVYNVCRGASVEIADVVRRLLAIAELDLAIEVDPDRLRPVDLPDLVGDPDRLTRATGWEPKISLDETLRDVLASIGAA